MLVLGKSNITHYQCLLCSIGTLTVGTLYIHFHLIAHNHNVIHICQCLFLFSMKKIKTLLKISSFLTLLPHLKCPLYWQSNPQAAMVQLYILVYNYWQKWWMQKSITSRTLRSKWLFGILENTTKFLNILVAFILYLYRMKWQFCYL